MSENNIERKWAAALSGMIRFFTEGYYTWSKENFYKAMHGEKFATDNFVIKKLMELDAIGAISFIGDDDKYIKITNYDKLIEFEIKSYGANKNL